jgi:protein Tex
MFKVDMARKRIALTVRLDDEVGPRADRAGAVSPRNDGGRPASRGPSRSATPARRDEQGSALADALRRAGLAEKRK